MIISSMNETEIFRELNLDLPEIMERAKRKADAFRRQIIKASRFPFCAEPLVLTSARQNRWIVILRALSRNERKHLSFAHCTYICTAGFASGLHAFVNFQHIGDRSSETGLAIFPPHFFSRYRSRTCLRQTGMALVARYFRYNNSYYRAFQEEVTDRAPMSDRKVYGTSDEGVALGTITSAHATIFKTFITYDMMHKGQISEFTQKEILRQREMQIYHASLASNSSKMIPRGETRLTLRHEKKLDKKILKIGLLLNALAAGDKTLYHPDDLQLFVERLMRLAYPNAPEKQITGSSWEETDYRIIINEVTLALEGMLMKMQANGIKPEVMNLQEMQSFLQIVKMNILEDCLPCSPMRYDQHVISYKPAKLFGKMIPSALLNTKGNP